MGVPTDAVFSMNQVLAGLLTLVGVLLGMLWATKPSRSEMQEAINKAVGASRVADYEMDQLLLEPIKRDLTRAEKDREELFKMLNQLRNDLMDEFRKMGGKK